MSDPGSPGADTSNGQLTHGSERDQQAAGDAAPLDPWFAPARQGDGGAEANRGHAAEVSDDTGWFLRTGRAGLRPDSMTESISEGGLPAERPETSGAPPWAGDRTGPSAAAPPPGESGPWPGPGEEAPRPGGQVRGAPASPAAADTGNWQATAAVGASVLPVVL